MSEILTAYTVVLTLDGRVLVVTDETAGMDAVRNATQADIRMTSRFIYDELLRQPAAQPTETDRIVQRLKERKEQADALAQD